VSQVKIKRKAEDMPTAFQRAFKKGKRTYAAKKSRKTVSPYSSYLPRAANQVVSVPRPRSFPAYTDTILHYVDQVTLNATSGLTDTFFFSCNGLFDPNITGTGHQPLGFDEWSAIYQKYRVLKSKITVHFVPNTVTTDSQAICGVRTQNASGNVNNLQRNIELPNSRYTIVSGDLNPRTVSCYWNINQLASKTDEQNMNADTTANPLQDEYFVIYYGSMDVIQDPLPVRCLVKIDYTVRFFDTRTLQQS